MAKAATALVAIALIGCASTPASMSRGVEAYRAGRNAEAAQYFMECASKGTPECMYNMGYMLETGRLATPDARSVALRWYGLAARHGLPQARTALVRLRAPVPPADLAPVPREPTPEELEAASALGELVGTAIGGGLRR